MILSFDKCFPAYRWIPVTSCSRLTGPERMENIFGLLNHDQEDIRILKNVGKYLSNEMALHPYRCFDLLLTVHLSIFISVINQLAVQNFCFTVSLFHASTCFEHMCSSSGGQNCITQPLMMSTCARNMYRHEINLL